MNEENIKTPVVALLKIDFLWLFLCLYFNIFDVSKRYIYVQKFSNSKFSDFLLSDPKFSDIF